MVACFGNNKNDILSVDCRGAHEIQGGGGVVLALRLNVHSSIHGFPSCRCHARLKPISPILTRRKWKNNWVSRTWWAAVVAVCIWRGNPSTIPSSWIGGRFSHLYNHIFFYHAPRSQSANVIHSEIRYSQHIFPNIFCLGCEWPNSVTIFFNKSNCCIVPRCSVIFWTHPEIIPVGQFFRRWMKSINQSSVDFHCKPFGWLIDWR